MARPRAFDESDVIDRAMRQFWSYGYEATSVDDLCAATGLNRSSLYRTFGSKRELLDTALTAYERASLQRIEPNVRYRLDRLRPVAAQRSSTEVAS